MESDHRDPDQCPESACDPSNRKHEDDVHIDLHIQKLHSTVMKKKRLFVPFQTAVCNFYVLRVLIHNHKGVLNCFFYV